MADAKDGRILRHSLERYGLERYGLERYGPAAAAALLALTLFAAPLPFASVGSGGRAALAVAAGLALALAAPAAARRRWPAAAAPALALAGLALWGLLQAAPLPEPVVAALSPERARLGARAAEALAAGAPEGAESGAVSALSLAPGASARTALGLAALAAAFLAAALAGREHRRRRWLAGALAAAAGFEVLYGLRRLTAGVSTIWGIEVPGASDRLRGTFVNPNHFAGYLEIALAVVLAWTWVAVRRGRFETSTERRLLLALPPALVWLGLFVALAFTRSRAGLAAGVVGAAAQGLALAAATRRWRLAPAGLAAAAAGVGVVAVIGLHQGLGRLAGAGTGEVAWSGRLELYRLTLRLWRDFPITGTGLGTFADALPLVQPGGLEGTYLHAHSDPLELALTGGAVALLLAGYGLWKLIGRLGRVLAAGARSEDRAAALAALGALAALAVHESFDFVLTTPANAFTLAVVCGAAAGARTARRKRRGRRVQSPAAGVGEADSGVDAAGQSP